MKKHLRRIVPFLLAIAILISIGWYLLVYDRTFTRDMLLGQARYFDTQGMDKVASLCYNLAYEYTGQDESVAIELANQYISDGNYTKAEQTLTNAIADGGTTELYIALCKTFVAQDKLQDAVSMLDHIADPAIKEEINALRPAALVATPAPGFYSQYISVTITSEDALLYYTTDGEYPSIEDDPHTEPIVLNAGETKLYALSVGENGLVSPLTILGYTIGGVIEEVTFHDAAMEAAIRDILGVPEDQILFTNELWGITEFTVPEDAQSLDDLILLPYMQKLTISNWELDSLAFLSSMADISELSLNGCRFPTDDLAILAALPKLTHLDLSQCNLSTIAALQDAKHLQVLNLSNNTLRNLEPLSAMQTLEEINLSQNAVTSLTALSTLPKLRTLDVSYNSLKELSPLAACQALETILAGNNSISSLAGLDALPVLTELTLDHNSLNDISLVSTCGSLKKLNVANNNLTSLYAVGSLTGLEELYFAYNSVESLPDWGEGCALMTIDGSYNKLTTIKQLKNMEQLAYVYMDYNELTSIDEIAKCYHLVLVNVYGNPIEDVSALTDHDIIVNYDPTVE